MTGDEAEDFVEALAFARDQAKFSYRMRLVMMEFDRLRAAVPAPITAEGVRAAERAWRGRPSGSVNDRAAFIADHLNRARDAAPDPGPGRGETTEGN